VRLLMRLLADQSDSWNWSSDAFPPLAFCVRALVIDGLAVAPFDRHTGGDGRLREVGLDADAWRGWLASVILQRETAGEFARAMGTPEARGPLLERARAAAEVLTAPGSFCPGSGELRARLNALFADYAPAGEAWKWEMSRPRRLHGSPRQARALWKALVPFHDRLPTISVFLVDYVEPVVMPLPPTTCLISPEADPERIRRQIVAVAEALVAAR
jgi:hypothetical protein